MTAERERWRGAGGPPGAAAVGAGVSERTRENSAAVANRSAATAAMAFRMACSIVSGTDGRSCRTLGASPLRRRAAMAWAVGPVKGGSPASIS